MDIIEIEEQVTNEFGGEWTEEKLSILTEYLNAYSVALSKQSWCESVYIDPFAGCGSINTPTEVIVGSVKRALSLKRPFHAYYFVEKDPAKADALRVMIRSEFPSSNASVFTGDANEVLRNTILPKINKRKNRGIVFLDPCAMHVQWDTIRAIASSGCLDFWYLFPIYAINRNLPRNGEITDSVRKRLDDAFGGPGWYESFYKAREYRQQTLFGDYADSENEKVASVENVARFSVKRLKKVFPAVLDEPYLLTNSNNAPLFYLVFAISNPSPRAKGLAMKIANDIFKKRHFK